MIDKCVCYAIMLKFPYWKSLTSTGWRARFMSNDEDIIIGQSVSCSKILPLKWQIGRNFVRVNHLSLWCAFQNQFIEWCVFSFFFQSLYLFCMLIGIVDDSNAIRYIHKSHFGNITPATQIGFVAIHALKDPFKGISSFGEQSSKTRSSNSILNGVK